MNNNTAFAPEFTQNAVKQFKTHWIEPEISRRKSEGLWPENFQVSRCLIRLPQNAPTIVEFNQEIRLATSFDIAPGETLILGEPIQLHQLRGFTKVERPLHNGKPVAFALLMNVGSGLRVTFDFSPNSDNSDDIDIDFKLGEAITYALNESMFNTTVTMAESINSKLSAIGLWPAPALIPYPLSLILRQIDKDNLLGARNTLVSYCSFDFLKKLVERWVEQPVFEMRKRLFRSALNAHSRQEFDLSIHALLPQIEGVMSDWLWSNHGDKEIPWRTESKTKKLHQILLDINSQSGVSQRKIVASTFEFIITVVLKGFKWTEADTPVDPMFPARHPVEHGRYLEDMFNEENSIKLFLLLDTLQRMI